MESTVRVNAWVTGAPTPLVAVKVIDDVPAVVGVPDSTPPAKVTPAGSVPLSVTTGVGLPVATGVKVPAVPTTKVVEFPEVNTGAVP